MDGGEWRVWSTYSTASSFIEIHNASLLREFTNIQKRLQYLQSLYKTANEDVVTILNYLDKSVIESESFLEKLTDETKDLLNYIHPECWKFASFKDSLPHITDVASLTPAYKISRGKKNVGITMGMLTMQHGEPSILLDTLRSLTSNYTNVEHSVLIILIAETDMRVVREIAETILQEFEYLISIGFIEIISPSIEYYPEWTDLSRDSQEGIRWRTKLNLDYAYLMAYARSRGDHYLQLNDDLTVVPGFSTQVEEVIQNVTIQQDVNSPWFTIDLGGPRLRGK